MSIEGSNMDTSTERSSASNNYIFLKCYCIIPITKLLVQVARLYFLITSYLSNMIVGQGLEGFAYYDNGMGSYIVNEMIV